VTYRVHLNTALKSLHPTEESAFWTISQLPHSGLNSCHQSKWHCRVAISAQQNAIYWSGRTPTATFASCYAALLPRRGPHIASHSVCPSVCPSVPLSLPSVTSRQLAN